MKSPTGWIHGAKWSVSGERDFLTNGWRDSRTKTARAARVFSPEVVMEVKV